MNDKAKCKNCTFEMIEEMAKEIEKTFYVYRGFCQRKRTECSAINNCLYCNVATHLTEQGYRKIPENSVVLTSEQYSNYLILQTNHEWLREKAKELQADNERLYKNLGKFKESVRKETAKEIIKWFIKYSVCIPSVKEINEFAKKYGVEVEE